MRNKKFILILSTVIMYFFLFNSVFASTDVIFREIERAFIPTKPTTSTTTVAPSKSVSSFMQGDSLNNNFTVLKRPISLNFNEAPLRDVITALGLQAGINIIIDKSVDPDITVTAVYNGVYLEEALQTITAGADLSYIKKNNIYMITAYEEKLFDVNKLFLSNTSTSPTMLASRALSVSDTLLREDEREEENGVSERMTDTESDFGGYIDNLIAQLQRVLSPAGVITYMPSGFIYVKDFPSRVRMIESVLEMDDLKREEINIKVTLIRIDYKDEVSTGVDWSAVLGRTKVGGGSLKDVGLNIKFPGNFANNNISTITLKNNAGDIVGLLNMLAHYGKVNVVHSWETRATSGTILPFELTQDIWYSEGNTIQVIGEQTITAPNINRENVGIKILLNPLFQSNNRYLVNTRIEISNVVGFQRVGDLDLPQTERNFIKVPIKMNKNDVTVISGFKIKSQNITSDGIPLLNKLPVLKYIFGMTSDKVRNSEFSVLITIDDVSKQ